MDLMDALERRHSIRAFTDELVNNKTLEELVHAAILAPSAVNAQPWHFTIIKKKALLDRISDESKTYTLKSTDRSAPGQIHEHLTDPHFHVFYGAPAVILISAIAGDWALEDAALAAENLMLVACSQGLGTCWIGLAQKWLATPDGKQSVELDPRYMPIAPIVVGYPKGEAPPVSRNAPIVHWID